MTGHEPVLLQEVLDGLHIGRGDTVVDATLGAGGYASAFCQAVGREGTVVGIDADGQAVRNAREQFAEVACTTYFIEGNFRNMKALLEQYDIRHVNAASFDLGLSSVQLGNSGRGFSFQKDEPLVMTFKERPNRTDITAAHIVNQWREEAIADVLFGYGGERAARKIARAIVAARKDKKIETTGELMAVIEGIVPRRGKIHPATRTFQALRIATNDELAALSEGLTTALELLISGGRIAVVSFHSLEDKIAKEFFKTAASQGRGMLMNKKVITPTRDEIKSNPRSRSAKLRIFIKQ